ncbi:MAG TPA: hypothetical protein VIL13_04095 [Longimicrobiales bacterium]
MSGACSGVILLGLRSSQGCGRGRAAEVGRGRIGGGTAVAFRVERGAERRRAETACPAGALPGAPRVGPAGGGGGSA